jgi:hypothetical protein
VAIDTAEKRRAVAGISVGWGITPNVAKDQQWRQEVGWSYPGILAASPTPPVPGGSSGGGAALRRRRDRERLVGQMQRRYYVKPGVLSH